MLPNLNSCIGRRCLQIQKTHLLVRWHITPNTSTACKDTSTVCRQSRGGNLPCCAAAICVRCVHIINFHHPFFFLKGPLLSKYCLCTVFQEFVKHSWVSGQDKRGCNGNPLASESSFMLRFCQVPLPLDFALLSSGQRYKKGEIEKMAESGLWTV